MQPPNSSYDARKGTFDGGGTRYFLCEGLEPSETMIRHIIEMEMDYLNTSHSNFVGGSKVLKMAMQQVKSNRITAPVPRQKDGVNLVKAPAYERNLKSYAILARHANGIVPDQL